MAKGIELLKDWRIILLIAVVALALLAIQPNFLGVSGAQITYLSPYSQLGNLSSQGQTSLASGSIITSLNGLSVSNAAQFYYLLNKTDIVNSTLTIGYENEILPYVYQQSSVTVFITKNTPLNSTYVQVQDVPFTNLNYGLDISGGTQINVAPNSTTNNQTLTTLTAVLQTRLNTYGLSGVSVSQLQTLSGEQFISISMPNIGESQALNLIQNQGLFYAKINNLTVFNSSAKNASILQVCLTSTCAWAPGVGEQLPTLGSNEVYQFQFAIQLSKAAAENFANATKNLSIVSGPSGPQLSAPIILYLNNKQISSLTISPDLKDVVEQDISISGSASSYKQALFQMKTLQAVMESGSLPIPIKIISINSVSPTTGQQFINSIYLLLVVSFVAVSIVIFARYKNYKISSFILLTSVSEIFIVIGLAAAIHWSIDVPSIAGIIASVGVSVDDQIIITDEILRGHAKEEYTTLKRRVQRAFFIIFVSFFSFAAIMVPLFFSSASLFTGFALTTILASLVGLLVTRPAYSKMVSFISEG